MAEEILVREPLTDTMIETGNTLLEALKAAHFTVDALFWLYTQESAEWRLVVVSPEVDEAGPKQTYADIYKLVPQELNQLAGFDPFSLTVNSPNSELVRALASVNKMIDLAGRRFSRNRFNGIFIDDIYIYCISDSVKPLPGPRYLTG